MYCIRTIKQLKYGYFETQAVLIAPCPCLFPSAALVETAYILHNHNLTVL